MLVKHNVISGTVEAAAWAAQVVTNGGSVSGTRQTLVANLIAGLKTDGLWTKLDRFWLFAAENSQSALTDMKGLTLATEVNSPTFTADDGYSTTATGSKYINSGFNASSQGVTYTLNSAHIGAWVFTAPTGAFQMLAGANNGSSLSSLAMGNTAGSNWVSVMNDLTNTFGGLGTTGHVIGTRTGSNATATYEDGGNKGTASGASVAIVNLTQFIGAENVSGTPSNNGNALLSAVHYGGGLNDTEVANFYTRMRTYMTAVGVP